jgi:hypothetical protein
MSLEISQQLAKHLYDVHFGGNWTVSNLEDQLADITWQQATTQVHGFNTIATLTYHVNYFVCAALKVLQGGPLDAKDSYSFDHPPIGSQEDWEHFTAKVFADATHFAELIGQLPESRLDDDFTDPKYGSYYRNIQGIIEHTHYHLGQIALIKKLVQAPNA